MNLFGIYIIIKFRVTWKKTTTTTKYVDSTLKMKFHFKTFVAGGGEDFRLQSYNVHAQNNNFLVALHFSLGS